MRQRDQFDHLYNLVLGELKLAPQHTAHGLSHDMRHPGLRRLGGAQARKRELDGDFRGSVLQALQRRLQDGLAFELTDPGFAGQLTADLRQYFRNKVRW